MAYSVSGRTLLDFDEAKIDTILAEDVEFAGELTFDRSLIVKGRLSGQIIVSGTLYVDETAIVAARVEVDRLRCKGSIKGDVTARSGIELFSTAIVNGDVTTPELVMESGSRLNGRCAMSDPAQVEASTLVAAQA